MPKFDKQQAEGCDHGYQAEIARSKKARQNHGRDDLDS